MFFIDSFQENTAPVKYILKDSEDSVVPASFYDFQMIRAEPNFRKHKRIERVIKQRTDPETRKREYRVTFVGYPGVHWITKIEFNQYKKDFN